MRIATVIPNTVIAALTAGTAIAQPVPNAGTTLRLLEPPPITLPRRPGPTVEVERPPGPAARSGPGARFRLNAFRITGATVFSASELLQQVEEFVGRDVDIADLGQATERLRRFYSERGYPLATAYLPAQEIKDGVVHLVLLEGRFGNVRLRNRSRARDATVTAYLQELPGRVVTDAGLERKLLLLYDLAGVAPATAVLAPGEAVGETDLRVDLDPGRAFAGGIELDNHGSRFTGSSRVSGRFEWFSPAGLGDRFSARAIKGNPGLTYARLGYQVPLGGDGWLAGVDYSLVRYRLGHEFAALDARGEADTWSAFASYPLLRSRRFSLYGRAGYERKAFEDRVGATATVTDKRSRLATLALAGDYFDALGEGGASAFSLTYSNGNVDIKTPAASLIDDASARTQGGFNKWNLNYLRLQRLTAPLSVFVSFSGQKASRNLDSSEKLILGGANGVRAYPQGEAPGDTGYLLTGELRYAFTIDALPGSLELVGFVDAGSVKLNENPFTAGADRRHLSGGGLGLNWSKPNDFTVRLSIAHRIGNEQATAGTDSKLRGWLQLVKSF